MSIATGVRQVSIAVAISLPGLITHEKLVTEPYTDIAGVRTVCVGETLHVQERSYTKSECLMRLAQRVSADYEAPIKKCTAVWNELPIEARSASISLAYNIGTSAFCKSSVRREFDNRDWNLACEKFKLWNKARVNGRLREVKGLTNRRADERELCLEGVTLTEFG